MTDADLTRLDETLPGWPRAFTYGASNLAGDIHLVCRACGGPATLRSGARAVARPRCAAARGAT